MSLFHRHKRQVVDPVDQLIKDVDTHSQRLAAEAHGDMAKQKFLDSARHFGQSLKDYVEYGKKKLTPTPTTEVKTVEVPVAVTPSKPRKK